MNDLINGFNAYFRIVSANSPALRDEVFRLRYQVYCKELYSQEIKSSGADICKPVEELEYDTYDERAIHCILRHRSSGKAAGVVRLIMPDRHDVNQPFPLELAASDHPNPLKVDPASLPRAHTAEISRLIVARDFRCRKGEHRSEVGNDQNIRKPLDSRPHFPHPVLGLFVAVVRVSAEHQLSHLYAAMEPVLNRLLRRFGMDLKPIGPVVQYFGRRQPFLGEIVPMAARLRQQHRDVWDLVTDSGRLLERL